MTANRRIDPERAILVTGAHRSGTTFLGRMLSLGNRTGYVSEPFNANSGLTEINRWFLYMKRGARNESRHRGMIADFLSGNAQYKRKGIRNTGLANAAFRTVFGSMDRFYYSWALLNPLYSRVVIKDPIACMASEYLHREFDMGVVVSIRHPAAFVSSLRRVNWRFDFQQFVGQNELMHDRLAKTLDGYDLDRLSPIAEASLLWKCIYQVLFDYLDENPTMIGLRHEDLSRRPIKELKKLYAALGLSFNRSIQRSIIRHTHSDNPVSARKNAVQDLKRDSAGNVKQWKKHLAPDDIDKIRQITEEVSGRYYDDSDW